MKPPCKDCPRREIGCHAKCPDYAEYAAERAKAREQYLKEKEVRDASIELMCKRKKRQRMI